MQQDDAQSGLLWHVKPLSHSSFNTTDLNICKTLLQTQLGNQVDFQLVDLLMNPSDKVNRFLRSLTGSSKSQMKFIR